MYERKKLRSAKKSAKNLGARKKCTKNQGARERECKSAKFKAQKRARRAPPKSAKAQARSVKKKRVPSSGQKAACQRKIPLVRKSYSLYLRVKIQKGVDEVGEDDDE